MADYASLRLVNAMVIGYMMGTYRVIGRGGAQAVANMAGEYVGQELLRFAREQEEPIESIQDLVAFAKKENLARQMTFEEEGDALSVRIAECLICPKKVGHYDFDGTACPWGGILIGALTEILGTAFSCSARLTPGETCTLLLKQKSPGADTQVQGA